MFAELKHSLRRFRGQLIGWGIGLALYGWLMAAFYDSLQAAEGLTDLLESYPQELLAFFGDIYAITTPAGYMDTYYFSYMTMIIGIFAIGACGSLLVGDEEKGILDLVMAYPVSRSGIFWGRLAGFLVTLLAILLISWLSWVIPSQGTGIDLTWLELLRPFLPLFAVLFLFGALALLLSMLLPSARMAGWISGALLVGNFLLIGLAAINSDLDPVARLTPLHFYQGGEAIHELNAGWVAGLLSFAILFTLLAWGLFLRRDIRVGGERSWSLPNPLRSLRLGRSETGV